MSWKTQRQDEICHCFPATPPYVTDISKLAQINEMRLRFFPDNPPTSTTVEVKALARPELMVEIEAVAATAK